MSTQLEKEYQEYKEQGRIWGLIPQERVKKIKFPRVSRNVINQFLELDDLTTTVSDILDSMGICGVVAASHLRPIIPGKKIVGHAVTIRNIPERKTPTQGYVDKDVIRMSTRDIYYLAEPGDVLVTDFGGNPDVSNMGGQSCTVAKSRGLAGSIVNGAVRDVSTIRSIDYPVWSFGHTPMTGKFRLEAIEMNGPVTLHNIVVDAGDLIIADDSGICVVPFDKIEIVLETAKSIIAEEDKMRELIVSNAPIDELRPLFRKRYK
ncbi:RraA family protein [Paenibacillus hamazuiensis]|uniref:RraA family protein n=1 Tax=Paenibacillus hamazuiensis TaxID=2936508 RepID=UPI00200D8E92|nr:RraA family protein [Paenibacillus hamazuiensis]